MNLNFFYKTRYRIINDKKLKEFIKKSVKIMFCDKLFRKFEFNFVFLDNKQIIKYNRKYLNKKYSTDILCFKNDKFSADFLISLQQIKKNAKIFNNDVKKELLLVVLHGLLHFKGMNDDTAQKREQMDIIAKKILETVRYKI
ncbi:MAG: rRNA maturation RNase YbeY [Endomicrobia bacterium]|nr:rRNA maturation RNase YbeY [Endomicrobiia bacterium]